MKVYMYGHKNWALRQKIIESRFFLFGFSWFDVVKIYFLCD